MKQRIERVRRLLEEKNLDGVLVTSEANFAWLTGGRYHINITTEIACATLWISTDRVECIVNNIEADRLIAEEGLTCDAVHIYPWYDETCKKHWLSKWTQGKRVSDDVQLAAEFQTIRLSLDEIQARQLRDLGKLVANALEYTCRECRPGEREYEVAGRLAQACLASGVEPVVNLVAGEMRAELYRHVLPTDDSIQKYAIVSVSGRKWGLVVSATRMVHFGSPENDTLQKYNAVLRVDATLISSSRPGTTLGDVLNHGIAAYGAEGYSDEWRYHHQGGLVGYLSREVKALPGSTVCINSGHILAWNPTIQGVKSEDTILVGEGNNEIITDTGNFPSVDVRVDGNVVRRPDILIRDMG